jgi:hypothetical protein
VVTILGIGLKRASRSLGNVMNKVGLKTDT